MSNFIFIVNQALIKLSNHRYPYIDRMMKYLINNKKAIDHAE